MTTPTYTPGVSIPPMRPAIPYPSGMRPALPNPYYTITPITESSPAGPLKRYYFNARGVNFVPEFYELYAHGERPYAAPAGEQGFSGVNNPMCVFKYFDTETIDEQLGYIRGIGCNLVRIWVSYYAWRHYQSLSQESEYLARLRTIQSLLHKHKLHVIWDFWDNIPPTEDSVTYPTDTSRWSSVISWTKTPFSYEKNTGFLTSIGFQFFSSIIPVLASSQATVGYEVGNELNVVETTATSAFVLSSIKKIYELDSNPRHPIAVGTVAMTYYETTSNSSWPVQNALFQLPEVRLLSFHPYYVLSSTLVKFISLASSASQKYGKPVIITEGGYTTNLQPWGRFLQEFSPCAIGFTLYTGIIGAASGHAPYKESTGLFHANGKVRVIQDALPFYQLAYSGTDRLFYQLDYPQEQSEYPANPGGVASAWEPLEGSPSSQTPGLSYVASGWTVVELISAIQNWSSRTLLASLTGTPVSVITETYKQSQLLNAVMSDFVLLSDKLLGTFGTSESYGFFTTAQDGYFVSSAYPAFTALNAHTCISQGTCWTSSDPWYFNVTGYDASYGVIGNWCSGILKTKGYF